MERPKGYEPERQRATPSEPAHTSEPTHHFLKAIQNPRTVGCLAAVGAATAATAFCAMYPTAAPVLQYFGFNVPRVEASLSSTVPFQATFSIRLRSMCEIRSSPNQGFAAPYQKEDGGRISFDPRRGHIELYRFQMSSPWWSCTDPFQSEKLNKEIIINEENGFNWKIYPSVLDE